MNQKLKISSSNKAFAIAKKINERLIKPGKTHDWEGILEIHETERNHFSHVNYATTMNQLGKSQSILRKNDKRLQTVVLLDVTAQLQNSATRSSWGAQEMATFYMPSLNFS